MKWFEGSINEAVATSKSKKAIFVVFIEGKDDTSVQFAEAINASEVSNRLEQDDFVAIRLESGSETYGFFTQIYKWVSVPSLFLIGENGAPLEVIAGNTTAADLASKIDLVLAKVGKNKDASVSLIDAEQKSSSDSNITDTNVKADVDQKNADATQSNAQPVEVPPAQTVSKSDSSTNIKDEPSTSLKASGSSELVKDTDGAAKELTTEEKVERARKLIEIQKKQRIEEEEKKEREREIERRKVGQDVQNLRRKQQDLEMKQAYEERLKERADNALARERILQQIAQDKIERKQRELAKQQQQVKPTINPPEPPESSSPTSTIIRIQFRLPSGNPYVAHFEPTTTLRELRTYVVQNIDLPFRQYAMSTSFPRRELTHDDDDKSLIELELVPTAVILILPLKNPNATTTVTSAQDVGIVPRFVWSTFAIFSAVYYYIIGYFTGGRADTPKQPSTSAENKNPESNASGTVASNVQNTASTSGLVRRMIGNRAGTSIKTEGNIHRLHSGGEDSDENNTWNGNSTQQM